MNSQEISHLSDHETDADDSEDDAKSKTKTKRVSKSLVEKTVSLPLEQPKERPSLPWLKPESYKPKPDKKAETPTDKDKEENTAVLLLSEADAKPVSAERAPTDGSLSSEEVHLVRQALIEADRLQREEHLNEASPIELTVNEVLDEVGDEVIQNHQAPEMAAETVLLRRGLIDEAEPPDTQELTDGGEIVLNHFEPPPRMETGQGGGGSGNGELPPEDGHEEPANEPPRRRINLNVPFRPDLRPAPAAAETATQPAEMLDRVNPAVAALIGGIIGYLIGRRRGRIKTEKKLLPVQKKLKKQVEDLNWEMKKAEAKVRQAVREKAEKVMPLAEAVIEKPVTLKRERDRPIEASHVHGGKAPEQIGHMLMTAETASPAESAEAQLERLVKNYEADKTEKLDLSKNVETMNRQELLLLSEKIIVDGSSLRQIYETHLVGEKGLRRLVAEHLKGGDLKKALRREIVEREIDFERDPTMRDLAGPDGGGGAGPARTMKDPTSLQQMIRRAESRLDADNEHLAYLRARADYENKQRVQADKQRQTLDVIFGSVIFILLGLVLILLLTRH